MTVRLFDYEAYPAHLHDPLRLEIASEILQKELSKQGWARNDAERERSLIDFWDTFHAIMGTWLLKSGLVRMLTAENWRWEKVTVPVEKLQLTAWLDQLQKLPGLDKDQLTAGNILRAVSEPAVHDAQRHTVEKFSPDATQNAYRIIAIQKEGFFQVMDGNRRSLRAILTGQVQIEAWVARTNDQSPRNFWLPIDHMMQVVSESRDHPEQLAVYQAVVANWFAVSRTAQIAFERRVVGMKGAAELLPKNLHT